MTNEEYKKDFEEVEQKLKTLHIRTRTFFTHKSRPLVDVIFDLAKKWNKYTEEEKESVYDMFAPTLNKKEDKKEKEE